MSNWIQWIISRLSLFIMGGHDFQTNPNGFHQEKMVRTEPSTLGMLPANNRIFRQHRKSHFTRNWGFNRQQYNNRDFCATKHNYRGPASNLVGGLAICKRERRSSWMMFHSFCMQSAVVLLSQAEGDVWIPQTHTKKWTPRDSLQIRFWTNDLQNGV
jgi:hypothetical protein